jgi:5-methylcytosine-specific restriction endonuclease McrA
VPTVIRPDTFAAAMSRIHALEDGERATKAETRAVYLLAGAARLKAPQKAPIPSVAHVERRHAQEHEDEVAAKLAMHDAAWSWNLAHTIGAGAPYGRCDCGCGGAFLYFAHGHCDHWIERSRGGPHTRANAWRLLPDCHERKGRSHPPLGDGPPTWNGRREAYCERAEIPFIPRKERT